MVRASSASRTHVWLENLGDWAWPGRTAPSDSLPLPPPWVPAFPPRLQPALAAPAYPGSLPGRRRQARRLVVTGLLSALVAVSGVAILKGDLTLGSPDGAVGDEAPFSGVSVVGDARAHLPLPALVPLSRDSNGSAIEHTSFHSAALDGSGSFYVYLPPGYPADGVSYPVLYLLHGRDGHATAFLEIGIQQTLDRLIGAGAIPPMIAVMVQDRPGLENWRNVGRRHSESYVVEVQEMIDRMLPTVATRAGRAIAGSSMGGFGAMHVALANPYRFSVVESWLGFFDNLEGELLADQPVIERLGLSGFLYGAEADPVAVPAEDPAFAARLRAAGAQAQSAIYPGGHSLEKIKEHLETGLIFAGRSLAAAEHRADIEEGRARWRG